MGRMRRMEDMAHRASGTDACSTAEPLRKKSVTGLNLGNSRAMHVHNLPRSIGKKHAVVVY